MKKQKALIGLLCSLTILLAACGGSGTPTAEGATAAPEEPTLAPTEALPPTAEPSSGGTGLCANDFFPVVVGATWNYSASSSMGDSSWTSTITDVSGSGFTMTNQFDELTATQQWSCTAEGLTALDYGGGPEATLAASALQGSFETTDTSGVTFPTTLTIGATWEQSFSLHGDIQMAEQSATADGTVTQTYTAVGNESVTVPAGTFDAMRIDTVIHMDMTISMGEGISVPFSFDSTTTNWWVQGLGWVKSVSSVAMEGSSIDSTTELQSYTIP